MLSLAKRTDLAKRALLRPWPAFDLLDEWFDKERWPRVFGKEGEFIPRINVFEKGDKLMVEAELPGIEKKDVEVTVEGDCLVLKGERHHEMEKDEDGVYRKEMAYGSFYRALPLDFEPDPKKVVAELHNGMLRVKVPMGKKAEKEEATKIAVT